MWKKKALRAVKYKGVYSGLQYPEQQIVGGKRVLMEFVSMKHYKGLCLAIESQNNLGWKRPPRCCPRPSGFGHCHIMGAFHFLQLEAAWVTGIAGWRGTLLRTCFTVLSCLTAQLTTTQEWTRLSKQLRVSKQLMYAKNKKFSLPYVTENKCYTWQD